MEKSRRQIQGDNLFEMTKYSSLFCESYILASTLALFVLAFYPYTVTVRATREDVKVQSELDINRMVELTFKHEVSSRSLWGEDNVPYSWFKSSHWCQFFGLFQNSRGLLSEDFCPPPPCSDGYTCGSNAVCVRVGRFRRNAFSCDVNPFYRNCCPHC